jgi:hypothetical protein
LAWRKRTAASSILATSPLVIGWSRLARLSAANHCVNPNWRAEIQYACAQCCPPVSGSCPAIILTNTAKACPLVNWALGRKRPFDPWKSHNAHDSFTISTKSLWAWSRSLNKQRAGKDGIVSETKILYVLANMVATSSLLIFLSAPNVSTVPNLVIHSPWIKEIASWTLRRIIDDGFLSACNAGRRETVIDPSLHVITQSHESTTRSSSASIISISAIIDSISSSVINSHDWAATHDWAKTGDTKTRAKSQKI